MLHGTVGWCPAVSLYIKHADKKLTISVSSVSNAGKEWTAFLFLLHNVLVVFTVYSICGEYLIHKYHPKLEPNQTSHFICSISCFFGNLVLSSKFAANGTVLYGKLVLERVTIPTQLKISFKLILRSMWPGGIIFPFPVIFTILVLKEPTGC